jgi:hypothetical protein
MAIPINITETALVKRGQGKIKGVIKLLPLSFPALF